MKKHLKSYAALLWLLLPVCRSAIAQPIVTHTVNFSPNSLMVGQTVSPSGIPYSTITYDDLGTVETVGAPAVPVQYVNLIVPPDIDYSTIRVTSVTTVPIPLSLPLYPAQYPVSIGEDQGGGGQQGSEGEGRPPRPFVDPNPNIYNSEGPYPSVEVEFVREGYFDGQKHIVTLAVYPVKYYPSSVTAALCTSITFDVVGDPTIPLKMHSIVRQPVDEQATYDDALIHLVGNPNDIGPFYPGGATPTPLGGPWSLPFYEYVVITTPDLIPAFQELIGWKRRKGVNAGIININDIYADPAAASGDAISGIVDQAGMLRQYLADAYLNGLVYAVIGGDTTIMPFRHASGEKDSWTYDSGDDAKIPADIYFSDFNTDWDQDGLDPDGIRRYGEYIDETLDIAPEIYVGRVLCRTEREVENMVHKIIQYERNPGAGNYAYLTRAFMSQADQCQDGNEAGIVAAQFPFLTSTIWQEFPSSSDPNPTFPNAAAFISQVTNNYGLVSILAHGSPNNQAIATANHNGCGSTLKEKVTFLDAFNGYCQHAQLGDGLDNLDDFNHRVYDYHHYPNIFYSIGCETAPMDTWLKSGMVADMSEVYTKYSKAGVCSYFGNSRYGWIYYSAQLFKQFAIKITSGSYHLGVANGTSKVAFGGGWIGEWLAKAMNQFGCPETEMWTATPSTFNPSISRSGSSVTVNTSVPGSKICVISAYDNGQTYFQRVSGVSSYTFTGVPAHYSVCITKHDYIPYLWNPLELIQNQTFNGPAYVGMDDIAAGQNVDFSQPAGPVKVSGTGNVIYHAEGDIILEKGFEVQAGGFFEAR